MSRVRPCGSCRVPFEAACASLRHLRLGRRERGILLAAATQPVHVVTTPGMTRAESAAARRAAQTLARAGLVVAADGAGAFLSGGASGASPGRAAVALSELGRYVMAAYGRYLAGGKPVRWTRPCAGVAVPGRDPSTLGAEAVDLARAELEATLSELAALLVAAVRGAREPSALESASRALEIKARGLRGVLTVAGGRQAGSGSSEAA